VRSLRAAIVSAAFLSTSLIPLPAAAQLPDAVQRQIHEVFSDFDHTNSPGCALAVYRDGEIVFARGYGMANLELGIAISPRTVFDIGSTSKQFTAFAVALLAEDGKLSLDDPVRKHFPEMPAYADRITVRNLVQHTSGLRDYLTLMSLAGYNFDDVTDDADALKLIVRQQAPNFAPNSEWLYSNSGYFLLSQIVKRVSGKTLRQFAAERIFQPLGMQVTHFHDDHTMIVPNRATGYSPAGNAGYRIDMSNFEQTGDGAVYTTVEELLLWDRNWYSGTVGGQQLLARQLETGKLTSDEDHGYAGGVMVGQYRDLRTVRHGGAWAGYRAELLRFPEQRTSIACLCNRGDADPSARADRVAEVLLADKLASKPAREAAASPPAATISPEQLARLAGSWRSPATGDIVIFEARDGKLYQLGRGTPLTPAAPDRLTLGPFTYIWSAEPAPSLKLERSGKTQDTYQRLPAGTVDSTALSVYAGSWYSQELDTEWRIVPAGNRLRIEIRERPSGMLRPAGPDLFSDGQRHLVFTRRGGRVTGMTVSAGRVRGIGFTRRGT
jgi:CubicO group peptidase (beta-lactamase class C family)